MGAYSKMIDKQMTKFFNNEGNMDKKYNTKEVTQLKNELACNIVKAWQDNSMHIYVGIFHPDALIVDVIRLMHEANHKHQARHDRSLFFEEDFLKFRTPINKVNPYIDYREKVLNLVDKLIDVDDIKRKISLYQEKTCRRLEKEYLRKSNKYKHDEINYYVGGKDSGYCFWIGDNDYKHQIEDYIDQCYSFSSRPLSRYKLEDGSKLYFKNGEIDYSRGSEDKGLIEDYIVTVDYERLNNSATAYIMFIESTPSAYDTYKARMNNCHIKVEKLDLDKEKPQQELKLTEHHLEVAKEVSDALINGDYNE